MIESTMYGQSLDIVAENVKKLKALFPEIVTEDKVDFGKLQAILGEYIDNENERYNFTWNGKGKALRLAQTSSTGTLRPCIEESKDWDTTQNLYIEGDNLEVLKLLQKAYHNKIKMIYIDPPYNTGNDFVYPDDYKDNLENYLTITGQKSEDGGKISTNSETSGRYHTNWLNMMYPRLRLARNLLTDNGVIFISIDDNEVDNLKKLCNEIFGEENFIANIVWKRTVSKAVSGKGIANAHDHIVVFGKSNKATINKLQDVDKTKYKNPDNDPRGGYKLQKLERTLEGARPSMTFPIKTPNGEITKTWSVSPEKYNKMLLENRIVFSKTGTPYYKQFLSEFEGILPDTWWDTVGGFNQDASKELKSLFNGQDFFPTPKPVELITTIIKLASNNNDIILDFFSGSATTAHAVMQNNLDSSSKHIFIMVQLPEPYGDGTEAAKAGYKNICEIGKERIRRAGEKIKAEFIERQDTQILEEKMVEPHNLDIGFKVFKLDSSNIKKWNPDYNNLETTLEDMISNYVDGRSEFDVVYEIMLKYGIDLTYPLEEHDFNGKKFYSIGFGALIICLDNDIDKEIAMDVIKLKKELNPEIMRVVFKDNGFKNDAVKTNVKENLKQAGIEEFVTI